jgi:hypothetical protein
MLTNVCYCYHSCAQGTQTQIKDSDIETSRTKRLSELQQIVSASDINVQVKCYGISFGHRM